MYSKLNSCLFVDFVVLCRDLKELLWLVVVLSMFDPNVMGALNMDVDVAVMSECLENSRLGWSWYWSPLYYLVLGWPPEDKVHTTQFRLGIHFEINLDQYPHYKIWVDDDNGWTVCYHSQYFRSLHKSQYSINEYHDRGKFCSLPATNILSGCCR